jgi:hypothetical protein
MLGGSEHFAVNSKKHNMKNKIKKSIVLLTMSSLIAGCSSTTVIHSRPEGAKLYLDDMYVGTTPYTQTDTKIVGATTPLKLTMDGYEPFYTHLSKDERPDVGAIIGGIFFLFPFLWTEGYAPEHTYELVPVSSHAAQQ